MKKFTTKSALLSMGLLTLICFSLMDLTLQMKLFENFLLHVKDISKIPSQDLLLYTVKLVLEELEH